MKFSTQQIRIGIASIVVLGTIGYLAVTGAESTKSYYVTVPEMQAMGEKAYQSNLRVEGFVKPETIQASGTNVSFILNEFESHNPKSTATQRAIRVSYQGSEPPWDAMESSTPPSFRPNARRNTLQPRPGRLPQVRSQPPLRWTSVPLRPPQRA